MSIRYVRERKRKFSLRRGGELERNTTTTIKKEHVDEIEGSSASEGEIVENGLGGWNSFTFFFLSL